MTSADLLSLIADDTKQISYRPRWNRFTGGITSTILLQQIIYRWVHNGRKPFYKFNEPCSHPAYRPTDSWCEELGFTRRELETARNRIATYTKGDLSLKTPVSYWRDADRKTWYAVNEMAVMAELEAIYPKKQEGGAGIQGCLELPEGNPDLMAESANSNGPDSDLMADSAISNNGSEPDLMALSAISNSKTSPKQAQNEPTTRGNDTLMADFAGRNAENKAENPQNETSTRENPDLMAESAISTHPDPDLMADSAISNEVKQTLMAESANSQCTNPPIANGGKRQYVMAESAIGLNTKNTTKKTTKKTIKTTTTPATQNESPDESPDDFVVVVLNWLGFVGEARKEPLTAATALAWAFWLQLNQPNLSRQNKDPLAITIAAWRRDKAQPPADCLRLAESWLAMSNHERRLTLDAASEPLFEIQQALPMALWPFDIPAELLSQLHRLTNGRFLPLELFPPEDPDSAEEQDVVSKPQAPTPKPSVPPYEMPPETAVLWRDTLSELKLQMTQATFNTWLRDSKLKLNGGTTAVVLVRNSYAADWINGRMQDTIGRTLSAIAQRDLTIEACEEADG